MGAIRIVVLVVPHVESFIRARADFSVGTKYMRQFSRPLSLIQRIDLPSLILFKSKATNPRMSPLLSQPVDESQVR